MLNLFLFKKLPVDELTLSIGVLRADNGGLRSHLQPPLSRVPPYVPWSYVPGGFAAMRLLALFAKGGADFFDDEVEPRTILTIERMLGVTEAECKANPALRQVFEGDDSWCDDVRRIVTWGVGLAKECPDRAVAQQLVNLPAMSPAALERVVLRAIN